MAPNTAARTVTHKEVSAHSSAKDCWVIIHGKVYDLTAFLSQHPGGAKVILKEAGRDATSAFSTFHPKDLIDQMLPKEAFVGALDAASQPVPVAGGEGDLHKPGAGGKAGKPPISAMLNTFDFESVARQVLTPEAWAYYSSGSDDEVTLRENHAVFQRIWLKPRILVNVKNVDLSTKMLGLPCSLPIYITACALGKLGNPEGEVVLTRAAGKKGIIQMMPTLASCSMDEMLDAAVPGQNQWYQLYVNQDRKVSERIVRHAEKRGVKGLFITVDAPQLGRREKDMRVKFVDDAPDVQDEGTVDRNQGAARAISSFIDPSLSWSDLSWFRSITSLPLMLKGVQTGADAVRAAHTGLVQGVVVSNHGGRQLDTSRSGVEVLKEVVDALRAAGFEQPRRRRFEVLVDGGFRRGADVFKALALGASGVGLGRPMLYSMSAYGQPGVERLIDVLRDELVMVMRLMGCTRISDICEDLVDARALGMHVGPILRDNLQDGVYEPLRPVAQSKL
ncbi:FMN-dependent dehydrogenase-domain-containing protein [Zopfochytrium polystomum]|nr:FMN-dependent dehydrogenase-domain-containing protein [Zopfochytrium polystomum]